MGICDLVRTSCSLAARRGDWVTIDDDRLRSLAVDPTLATEEQPASSADGDEAEAVAATTIIVNAINFGSGYHDVVEKLPGRSGASTMAERLRRRLASIRTEAGAIRTDWLHGLTALECAAIFGQRLDHDEQAELMALFASALTDLAHFVDDGFDGSFLAVVEAADRSAERLAESLLAMPFYRDRAKLDGTGIDGATVHFYKRAQITAADLARDLAGHPTVAFTDLDSLTAFADNLVPHVLRIDGVLRFDPVLASRIEAGELLPPGSPAEIEMRACGVEAVERLVAERARQGQPTRAMDLDLALWTRGGGPAYKAVPRPRSRCVYY